VTINYLELVTILHLSRTVIPKSYMYLSDTAKRNLRKEREKQIAKMPQMPASISEACR